jgi:hypothetical protein
MAQITKNVSSATGTSQGSTKIQTSSHTGRIASLTYTPANSVSASGSKARILTLLHKKGEIVTVVGHKVVSSFTQNSAVTLEIHSDDVDVDATNSVIFWMTSPHPANDGISDPGGDVVFTLPN